MGEGVVWRDEAKTEMSAREEEEEGEADGEDIESERRIAGT